MREVVLLACVTLILALAKPISLNGHSIGRRFDGIGGLSGGGATSRLLVDYEEPYRSQILDYLFLPNFGASLHILKVEIGGDCQTTDGTEPSHMRSKTDLNFHRGYEWWLMVEAKKRNPDILLYALSWGVPGWIGNGNFFSDDNVLYHVEWIKGAKQVYNLNIDYIGIWNEREYSDDKNCTYIKNLRSGLDAAGFHNTKIVAADGNWNIVNSVRSDEKLSQVVDIIGVHYPGTDSPQDAKNLGKQLWASEDYSTYADIVGGGCWARILNQNYVNGLMTSTISWNLAAAYYENLPFGGDGLLWAVQPWAGNYEIKSPIWVSAHTTQFTKPGWRYLSHGNGVGHLPMGGSYVTLVPENNIDDWTLVIETLTHDNSICIRPNLPPYNVAPQHVTFQLENFNLKNKVVSVWKTQLGKDVSKQIFFEKVGEFKLNDTFNLKLEVDQVYTLSTLTGQKKGSHGPVPAKKEFPARYRDNFQNYPLSSEARFFADQTGSWEIYQGSHGKTMRQSVLQPPITWCGESKMPITFIGDVSTKNFNVSSKVYLQKGQAMIGGRFSQGGCTDSYKSGYSFILDARNAWEFYAGEKLIKSGSVRVTGSHAMALAFDGSLILGFIDGHLVFELRDSTFGAGWAALGSSYDYVEFGDFELLSE